MADLSLQVQDFLANQTFVDYYNEVSDIQASVRALFYVEDVATNCPWKFGSFLGDMSQYGKDRLHGEMLKLSRIKTYDQAIVTAAVISFLTTMREFFYPKGLFIKTVVEEHLVKGDFDAYENYKLQRQTFSLAATHLKQITNCDTLPPSVDAVFAEDDVILEYFVQCLQKSPGNFQCYTMYYTQTISFRWTLFNDLTNDLALRVLQLDNNLQKYPESCELNIDDLMKDFNIVDIESTPLLSDIYGTFFGRDVSGPTYRRNKLPDIIMFLKDKVDEAFNDIVDLNSQILHEIRSEDGDLDTIETLAKSLLETKNDIHFTLSLLQCTNDITHLPGKYLVLLQDNIYDNEVKLLTCLQNAHPNNPNDNVFNLQKKCLLTYSYNYQRDMEHAAQRAIVGARCEEAHDPDKIYRRPLGFILASASEILLHKELLCPPYAQYFSSPEFQKRKYASRYHLELLELGEKPSEYEIQNLVGKLYVHIYKFTDIVYNLVHSAQYDDIRYIMEVFELVISKRSSIARVFFDIRTYLLCQKRWSAEVEYVHNDISFYTNAYACLNKSAHLTGGALRNAIMTCLRGFPGTPERLTKIQDMYMEGYVASMLGVSFDTFAFNDSCTQGQYDAIIKGFEDVVYGMDPPWYSYIIYKDYPRWPMPSQVLQKLKVKVKARRSLITEEIAAIQQFMKKNNKHEMLLPQNSGVLKDFYINVKVEERTRRYITVMLYSLASCRDIKKGIPKFLLLYFHRVQNTGPHEAFKRGLINLKRLTQERRMDLRAALRQTFRDFGSPEWEYLKDYEPLYTDEDTDFGLWGDSFHLRPEWK